jgi:heavy metal translocating P-type ATPase
MRYHIVNELPGRMRVHLLVPDRPPIDRDHLEARFENMAGVKKASFSPRTGNILIHYDGRDAVREALLDKLESSPFPKTLRSYRPSKLEIKKKRVIRSGAMLLMGPLLPPAVRPALVLYGAFPILKKGAVSLRNRRITGDLLDATAIGVSIASRDYSTASIISFLLKLGDFLEEWTRRRFRKQLAAMFRTGEEQAWVFRDGREIRVKLGDVRVGDAVVVRMGSLIPVDGVIVEGEALVNQASLTGESLPVMKRKGKLVYAGTALEEGFIQIEALKVGGETRAARVVKVIEEAEGLKAHTQSHGEMLADKVAPYSFLLSGITYALTGSANRAAAVLLVDYSCAIKLSTPLAILSGLARAARENVLIKGGRSLEKLSQSDAFILDKTGTLTEAAPQVIKVHAFGYSEDYILRQAACVEEHFPHPVASAVVRYAAQRGLMHEEEHDEVEYILAHGIVSNVHGRRIMVGSRHFIQDDEGIDISEAAPVVDSFARSGYSILYVAIGDKLAGLIAVHDPLRAEARGFIDRLRQDGVGKVVILTGDNEPTARAVAGALGITDFHAQAFPETKVEVVKELQRKGHVVAMMGDGINDSPALSHADVGISLKQGADIAREACDVLLMEGVLDDVLKARTIARETLDLIRGNYRTIVAVNSLVILMAVTGSVPPILSALAHNLSTIGVSLMALKPMGFKAV